MEISWVKTTVHHNSLGELDSMVHEWDGKSPYVVVAGSLIKDLLKNWDWKELPEKLEIGPYKLLLVEKKPEWDGGLYVREDRFGAARIILYKSTRWLDLAYRRSVLTLAVWNLADCSRGSIPSWRDIKLFKKGKKR